MIRLFLGLTIVNLLALCLTAASGYMQPGPLHQLSGALATICCCAVHCIVFTYFIATAKWAQHAVTVRNLSPQLVEPTRSFKSQAFPAALLAMFSTFIAAVIGVATFSYHLRPIYHLWSAIVCLLINAVAAWMEYFAISRNGALIDGILAQLNDGKST